MLIFNGKKYFVPFFNGGSGEQISNCEAVVSNYCSNSVVDVYAQQFLGEFPFPYSVGINPITLNIPIVNGTAMYIIRDGVIVPNYNPNECKFDSWDNFMWCITNADNTKIKFYDTALSDDGAGLHQMNTDVITSPLDADETVDIDEWNESLKNMPFYFGGVPEAGTDISDTTAYCHIAFSIDGDTFYIRDVDNDVVICTVVDGVPNWTENYYSQWFIPSYSARQGAPLSFISWFTNNVESSEYYYDLSNMAFVFSSSPTFGDWDGDVIRVPFRDQNGTEYGMIFYMKDYRYDLGDGTHIEADQILLDGYEPVYVYSERGLTTSMVIIFGDNTYIPSGAEYEWFWGNGGLVPKDEI